MKSKYYLLVGIIAILLLVVFGNRNRNSQVTPPDSQPTLEAGYINYTNEDFGYSLVLPDTYKPHPNGDYSILFYEDNNVASQGQPNFIYVSVVPEKYLKDLEAKIVDESVGEIYNFNTKLHGQLDSLTVAGDSIDISEGMQTEYFTYTLSEIREMDSGTMKIFENSKPWEFPGGTTEVRRVYTHKGNIYILGYYAGGEGLNPAQSIDPRVAYKILESFTVNDSNESAN